MKEVMQIEENRQNGELQENSQQEILSEEIEFSHKSSINTNSPSNAIDILPHSFNKKSLARTSSYKRELEEGQLCHLHSELVI